jgi:hypothetical protein
MDEFGTIDGGRLAGGPDIAPEDEERPDRGRDDDAAERTAGNGWVIVDDMASGDPDRRPADSSDDSFPAGDPPTSGSDPASTR